jgi:hypothetical protein
VEMTRELQGAARILSIMLHDQVIAGMGVG